MHERLTKFETVPNFQKNKFSAKLVIFLGLENRNSNWILASYLTKTNFKSKSGACAIPARIFWFRSKNCCDFVKLKSEWVFYNIGCRHLGMFWRFWRGMSNCSKYFGKFDALWLRLLGWENYHRRTKQTFASFCIWRWTKESEPRHFKCTSSSADFGFWGFNPILYSRDSISRDPDIRVIQFRITRISDFNFGFGLKFWLISVRWDLVAAMNHDFRNALCVVTYSWMWFRRHWIPM